MTHRAWLAMWVMCVAGLLITACDRHQDAAPVKSASTTQPQAHGKPVIIASIFPLADLTQRIVGDAAVVKTMMPPGANPHAFEPTPQQLMDLADADVLVAVGMNLDNWALRAAHNAQRPTLAVVRFSELVGYESPGEGNVGAAKQILATQPAHDDDHDHDHAGPNPHVWLDPDLTMQFVRALAGKLAQRYPEHTAEFVRNGDLLADDIQDLDDVYRDRLDELSQRKLVTFHNAFDQLAKRYDLEVVAHLTPIELSPQGEVTFDRLKAAIDAVKKYDLKAIYAEPQFPDQAMQRIHEQTGAQVLKLDPEGNPSVEGYDSYLNMMRSNLDVLVQGQSIGQPAPSTQASSPSAPPTQKRHREPRTPTTRQPHSHKAF